MSSSVLGAFTSLKEKINEKSREKDSNELV
jgi:hypothetical protein